MIELRPYQERGLADVRAAMRAGRRRVLYVAPTGSGKTILFAWLARAVEARGKRVAVVVHRRELLRQTADKLSMVGAAAEVRTVQEHARRLDRLPDLLVVDEAHHAATGTSWARVVEAVTATGGWVLGVTATPARLDGAGLRGSFDALVTGPTPLELIEQGWLASYEAFAPAGFERRGIGRSMGDFARGAAAERARPIVGCAVREWRDKVCGPALAFCCTVTHAEEVAAVFRAAGHRAASVDGKMSDAERSARIDALGAGELDVLASCDLVGEGLDVPEVRGVVMLRPTKSLALHLQQCGRALRPKAGGEGAVIIDHVGNLAEHGLPCQHREWSLDGWRQGPVGRTCPRCSAVSPPGRRACVACGTALPVEEREAGGGRRQPETVEGRLARVDPVTIAGWRSRRMDAVRGARSLRELELIAAACGYKRGFVFHEGRRRGWIRA